MHKVRRGDCGSCTCRNTEHIIYVAAVEELRKKERRVEIQFGTKSSAFLSSSLCNSGWTITI